MNRFGVKRGRRDYLIVVWPSPSTRTEFGVYFALPSGRLLRHEDIVPCRRFGKTGAFYEAALRRLDLAIQLHETTEQTL